MSQPSCGKTGNLFFTAGVSEVDPALRHTIENRADQMRQTERRRHVRIHFMGKLPEVVEVPVGKGDGLQLIRPSGWHLIHLWHQVHGDGSRLRSVWRGQIPTLNSKVFSA
ncbi:MAG TPA: hypothetical protein VJZ00_15500 [Thermoanaerobaculia bacterium]|nr:hypothetical protein [Thermoanaerobaculia bacterium]